MRTTHGMTYSFEFSVWTAMRKRCRYKKHPKYHLYGGRGIDICKQWDTFENFFKDMGKCPILNGSIDRINNDRGYEPSNCRWIAKDLQSRNRRNVVLVNGKSIPELSKLSGLGESTIRQRIKAGWDVSKLTKSPQELGTRN